LGGISQGGAGGSRHAPGALPRGSGYP
jgi:hypothetical protein